MLSAGLAVGALTCGVALGDGPPAPASITAVFHPDRLGAMGALSVTIDAGGGPFGPAPLQRAIVRLPDGLGVEIPHIVSCRPGRLRMLGARGCPARSRLGVGRALAEAQLGSQLLSEKVSLWVFLGPLHNLQPTFEILAQGFTPFHERFVLTGSVLPDNAPFGEDLVLQVPPIPTLPLEPDASIASISLTIGATRRSASEPNSAIEPSRCPSGGFPFGVAFTFAGGIEESAASTAPCPR